MGGIATAGTPPPDSMFQNAAGSFAPGRGRSRSRSRSHARRGGALRRGRLLRGDLGGFRAAAAAAGHRGGFDLLER